MKAILVLVALCSLVARAPAQTGSGGSQAGALLTYAKDLYARRQLERALPLLRELVAPGSPMEVTLAQRVEAYKYLGAAHALAGRRDSAITHFGTALAWDPFTDVRPPAFSREQAAMFVEARRQMFAVAIRPIAPTRIELRADSVKFTAVATHLARVRVSLRSDSVKIPLYDGEMDGVRVFVWSGMDRRGQPVPAGRYRLSITAQSRVMEWQDSTWVLFNVAHEMPAAEHDNTDAKAAQPAPPVAAPAPPTRTTDSARIVVNGTPPGLQERRGNPGGDVAKAFAIATGAFLVGGLVANDHLGGGGSQARIIAGLATVTGVIAILRARANPPRTPPALPPARTPPVETVVRRPEPVAPPPPPAPARRTRVSSKPVLIITPTSSVEP